MSNIERVTQFLKEVGTYYLATVEDDQPRVRPFGTAHIFEDKLYFQTGLSKDVAKQMEKNPKFEICGYGKGTWVRVEGEAIHDPRIEAQESLLEAYPSLKKMYAAGDGNTAVYYIKNGKATFYSFTSEPEVLEF